MNQNSFVYWYPSPSKHRCGYCNDESGNFSHGMWASSMTCEDYQNLIDRGWRRSGQYCYKPLMEEICCPMYTIKCDVKQFQLSKSQKKVIKKFNKYLNDGILSKFELKDGIPNESTGVSEFVYREAPKFLSESKECPQDIEIPPEPAASSSKTAPVAVKPAEKCVESQPKPGVGADPSKPACKKAKTLRLERKQAKLLKRGMSLEKLDAKNEQKTLEEFLHIDSGGNQHKFRLDLVSTSRTDDGWERLKEIEFELYKKYQIQIHNDPSSKCSMKAYLRFLVNSPLEITLEQLDEAHEHFKISFELYQKYQSVIHNDSADEIDEESFTNFLIDSPLKYVKFSNDSVLGFGSFHQLYWLDDKLIAVGVIDILPKCVSAVYFFYDPDYRNLTLGTYGSLREVEFTRQLHQQIPALDSYYMGYYIHSCPKMRYKGKLTPSYLLCPETYVWIEIEKCLEKLERSKYSRFNDDLDALDENCCTPSDVDKIKLLYKDRLVFFGSVKNKCGKQGEFNLIGSLIGRKCAKTLIFYG